MKTRLIDSMYSPHFSGNSSIKTPKGTLIAKLSEQGKFYWDDCREMQKLIGAQPFKFDDVCAEIIAEVKTEAKRQGCNSILICANLGAAQDPTPTSADTLHFERLE